MKLYNNYKRLSRSGHLLTRYTLWVGTDHLFQVSAGMFKEEYKRFYFQDIQSIIMYKTQAWKAWNWVLACFGALFLFTFIASENSEPIFSGIMAAVTLVLLLINFFMGPTCMCYIQTAVQRERLHSLNRISKTEKAMNALKPIILDVQKKGNQFGKT